MASNTENSFAVCRTCLKPIPRQSDLGAGASHWPRKLSLCFPELNLALTSNPALCNLCHHHQTAVKILEEYLLQAGSNITTANLAQIAKANQNESAVVDVHIEEEINQESGNYCLDNTLESSWVQQNINSQLASPDDSSQHCEFKCQHCNFSTKYKSNLKRRMVNHTTQKLQCYNCDYSTKHKYNLRRHMILHTTKKLKCKHCDFSTKHKRSLKRHMVNHPTAEFKSHNCDYSTRPKYNLRRQIVIDYSENGGF